MDTIEITEKQRKQLEESISKLRKALKHWQTHSAEYEGLKEELLALPKNAGRDAMLAIADDFGGDVITRNEITSFLGDKEGVKRNPVQVAAAVKHRIDYIQENVDKIEKQLEIGESTLDNVRVIQNSGRLTNEEGLPVMDIKEELDARGNVISSDVNPEGSGSAKPFNIDAAIKSLQPMVKTLAKKEKEKAAGAKPAGDSKPKSTTTPKSALKKPAASQQKLPTKEQIQQKKPEPTPEAQSRTPKRIQATEKEYSAQTGMILTEKRVKPQLVPDVKEEVPKPEAKKDSSEVVKEIIRTPEKPSAPTPSVEISSSEQVRKEGVARIRVIDDEDSDASDDPFENLPDVEESEEDARLREEMLKYNMREINNIVGEIELEEEGMSDDYSDDDEDMLGSDEDEDEDKWGRSQGQLVSDKVRREMMILQKKIEAREKAQQVATEVGSSAAIVDTSGEPTPEDAKVEPIKKEKKKSSEKKGVRFAEELDISPAPAPITKPPSNPSQLIQDEFDEEIDPSILDMVFGPGAKDQEERFFQENTTEQPKKKLPSLFKAARQVQKAKEELAIEKTIAAAKKKGKEESSPALGNIVERELPKSKATAPKPPTKTNTKPVIRSTTGKQKADDKKPTQPAVLPLDPLGDELSDEDRPIMAASIIEREPTWKSSIEAPAVPQREPRAPNELDPDFHQREVTDAYFAMRNKLIQKQGGFVETEEEKMIVPIDENLDKKKVSRFKAGRVKNQLP